MPDFSGKLVLIRAYYPSRTGKRIACIESPLLYKPRGFSRRVHTGGCPAGKQIPPRFRHIEGNPPWSSSIPFSSRSWRLAAHLVDATDSDTASITATATAGTSTPTTKEGHLQLHLAADQEPITPKPRSSQQLILPFYQLCRASALPTTPPLNHVGGQ